jgi:NAD(P)-dependent dehydrogenase (short-subunit alcohol dehydrogenase family)
MAAVLRNRNIGESTVAARVVETAMMTFDSIDAMVNGAGIFFSKPVTSGGDLVEAVVYLSHASKIAGECCTGTVLRTHADGEPKGPQPQLQTILKHKRSGPG